MKTIQLVEKTDKDGALSLRIVLGEPEVACDVVVVVQPKVLSSTRDERGWPAGYFERTFGAIEDETFVDGCTSGGGPDDTGDADAKPENSSDANKSFGTGEKAVFGVVAGG